MRAQYEFDQVRGMEDLRTTTRVSPGRQPSVWERWAMVAAALQAWLGRGVCFEQRAGVVMMACSGGNDPSVEMLHEGILQHSG